MCRSRTRIRGDNQLWNQVIPVVINFVQVRRASVAVLQLLLTIYVFHLFNSNYKVTLMAQKSISEQRALALRQTVNITIDEIAVSLRMCVSSMGHCDMERKKDFRNRSSYVLQGNSDGKSIRLPLRSDC